MSGFRFSGLAFALLLAFLMFPLSPSRAQDIIAPHDSSKPAEFSIFDTPTKPTPQKKAAAPSHPAPQAQRAPAPPIAVNPALPATPGANAGIATNVLRSMQKKKQQRDLGKLRNQAEEDLLANASSEQTGKPATKITLNQSQAAELDDALIKAIAKDFRIPENEVANRCELDFQGLVMSTELQRGFTISNGQAESEYGGALVRVDFTEQALCKLDQRPPGKGNAYRIGDRYRHYIGTSSCRPREIFNHKPLTVRFAYKNGAIACEFAASGL